MQLTIISDKNKIRLLGKHLDHSVMVVEAEKPYIQCFNLFNAEAIFVQSTSMQGFFENHLNPVMSVFIGKLLLSTLR